jgi:hypothetical protein
MARDVYPNDSSARDLTGRLLERELSVNYDRNGNRRAPDGIQVFEDLRALVALMRDELLRGLRGSAWIKDERTTMLSIVNGERRKRGAAPMEISQIESVEGRAMAHVDYVEKYALYCAQLVLT